MPSRVLLAWSSVPAVDDLLGDLDLHGRHLRALVLAVLDLFLGLDQLLLEQRAVADEEVLDVLLDGGAVVYLG